MMQFLRKLISCFAESRARAKAIPQGVGNQESISHFLFSENHFVRSSRRVKHHAFTNRNGEVSVFRIDGLDTAAIFEIGRRVAGSGRSEQLKGRADLTAAIVRRASLDVVPVPRTHVRHANIVGWPQEKERDRVLSMELASNSTLHLPPTSAEAKKL